MGSSKTIWRPAAGHGERNSAAGLLKEFFRFYHRDFDWGGEAVAVRQGKRGRPTDGLPLHVVVHSDGVSQVAPTIEDPFEIGVNLSVCLTAPALSRLREEIARAACTSGDQGGSLKNLLETWVPPEQDSAGSSSGSSSKYGGSVHDAEEDQA